MKTILAIFLLLCTTQVFAKNTFVVTWERSPDEKTPVKELSYWLACKKNNGPYHICKKTNQTKFVFTETDLGLTKKTDTFCVKVKAVSKSGMSDYTDEVCIDNSTPESKTVKPAKIPIANKTKE